MKTLKIGILLSFVLITIFSSFMLLVNNYNIMNTIDNNYYLFSITQIVIMSFSIALFVDKK